MQAVFGLPAEKLIEASRTTRAPVMRAGGLHGLHAVDAADVVLARQQGQQDEGSQRCRDEKLHGRPLLAVGTGRWYREARPGTARGPGFRGAPFRYEGDILPCGRVGPEVGGAQGPITRAVPARPGGTAPDLR